MKPLRVLIIDDEPRIRETVRLALETDGFAAATAADGEEGLRRHREEGPWDLVLLDQRMPGMEGEEVLRRLRESDPTARVVLMTAYGTVTLAADVLRGGAVAFLRKPFGPDEVREMVRGALYLDAPGGRDEPAADPDH